MMHSHPPIVVCSTLGTSLSVMLASVAAYVPASVTVYLSTVKPVDTSSLPQACIVTPNEAANFGDAYNAVIERALSDGHESVVIANDDIVLAPETYPLLMEDVDWLLGQGIKAGMVGARADRIAGSQNIRHSTIEGEKLDTRTMRWQAESQICTGAPVIFPVLAWLSSGAFSECRFPPLNWFSDTIICEDLAAKGYVHCISRAYCHHAGSQTLGGYTKTHFDEAMSWVRANRPELARRLDVEFGNDW